MNIRIDTDNAMAGLLRARSAVMGGVENYGRTAAGKLEAYAKANRPWTDRTGNARRTMEGTLEHSGRSNVYTLGIVGHMPYSVNLELSYGQKYAILYPTVNALSAEILQGWADTIRGLK